MRLGNQQAARYYNERVGNAPLGTCGIEAVAEPWCAPVPF